MRVYSTRNFLTLLTTSIIIALALTYALTSLAPSYLSPKSPSYTLSSNPTSLQVSPGSAGSYTLKFTSQNGFAGSLKLSARVPNAPNILAVSISPAEVPLSSGETASVTLNVATNPVTPAGTYSIAIDGTSGTLSQTNTVNLNVVGFTVTSDPASLYFPVTASGRASIAVTSVNGFSGQVNLFASSSASGPTVNINPNTLFVAQNRTATSTLIVQSSAQGRFDVTVTVIGNQFYQSVSLPVTITSTSTTSDFDITAIPSSFSINPGNTRNVLVKLTTIGDCGCLVTISASTSGAFGYGISPYIVEIPPGGSVNSTVTFYANNSLGDYKITITGTSLSIVHSTQLTATITSAPVPDISLEASPTYVHVTQGSSNSTPITIKSLGGFAGTVSLTTAIYPMGSTGITLTLNPASVQLFPDGTATSNLTITASTTAIAQGYNYTITGIGGTIIRTAYGNFIVVPRPAAVANLVQASTPNTTSTNSPNRQLLANDISTNLAAGSTLNVLSLLFAGALAIVARPSWREDRIPLFLPSKTRGHRKA